MESDQTRNLAKKTSTVSSEDILTVFKRRGLFDSLRKEQFKDFKQSKFYEVLLRAIQDAIDADNNANSAGASAGTSKNSTGSNSHTSSRAGGSNESVLSIASRNRGKAAALVEGSVNRSEAFGSVNRYIDDSVSGANQDLKRRIEELVRQIFQELEAASAISTNTDNKDEKATSPTSDK
ncbi:hypothetical protein V1511DRAFT_489692 [Dipodascopsis uninucleata]